MSIAIVRHRIADYAKWRSVFDADEKNRKAAGTTNPHVYRSADDKNEIVMIFDVADVAKAKAFVASPQLREAMGAAGVVDQPSIHFLNPV